MANFFKSLFFALTLLVSTVHAQQATAKSVLHPWQAVVPSYENDAHFTNLANGDTIETPFRASFGISGVWGLASINQPTVGKNGHHHLLINKPLPTDFNKALPFNDQYIHFGKGQMETVLNLTPGKYTLRLLLADHKHVPHYVHSKPVEITVVRQNKAVDPQSLVLNGISILSPAAGARFKDPFRVQFHASGINVGALKLKEKDTGHFRLSIIPAKGGKAVDLVFANGQTETWLAPPAGSYQLKLDLLDNTDPGRALAKTVTSEVIVE